MTKILLRAKIREINHTVSLGFNEVNLLALSFLLKIYKGHNL